MKGLKILLIDDEKEFVTTLAERLEIRGFFCETALDGEAGLEHMEKKDFDIVVVDLMMPGLTGLDVLKKIKASNFECPVILLTGHGSTKEGIEGMRIGAYDYLMKPINIEDLIEKISDAVTKKQ